MSSCDSGKNLRFGVVSAEFPKVQILWIWTHDPQVGSRTLKSPGYTPLQYLLLGYVPDDGSVSSDLGSEPWDTFSGTALHLMPELILEEASPDEEYNFTASSGEPLKLSKANKFSKNIITV